MKYAEVAVNSPLAQRKTFSYSIPPSTELLPGQPVWVPFGTSLRQGIVLELTDTPLAPPTEIIKEIAAVINNCAPLSPQQIMLARWISSYYLAPLFESLALMLPPGFEQHPVTSIQILPDAPLLPKPSDDQKYILDILKQNNYINVRNIENHLGKNKTATVLAQLQDKGIITRVQSPDFNYMKPRTELILKLNIEASLAQHEVDTLEKRGAHVQSSVLRFLIEKIKPVSTSEVFQHTPANSAVIKALVGKKLISTTQNTVRLDPLSGYSQTESTPPQLTQEQESVWGKIKSNLKQAQSKTYLLNGITGSGKTEIYLRALGEAITQGKRGIVLVPEIALTPQTISRFVSRFPGQVAVLHSQLTLREQFDEWMRIRDGQCRVVIGSRGAIFAPQPDLGLIILDEEHEWTYKQHDQVPRYHAREVARILAQISGATVILGSATPDVESYYRCTTGEYALLTLSERVGINSKPQLPGVEIVDMRRELKAGNISIFSRHLHDAINEALKAKDQVILFLNRRGTSTFVQCRNCGYVIKCEQCNIALTHHATRNELVCHHCNRHTPVPRVCPRCGSEQIKFLGLGTEGLFNKTAHDFPEATILRWDKDVTLNRHSHEEIMSRFSSHKADILIGTQMIAKGLDFPSVSLVGVISADTVLTLPDLRASERTFQLLSQVTGRAGRGAHKGKAIIQTYNPQHYAISAVAENNYKAFYEKEMEYRKQLNAPPFTQLARLVYTSPNNLTCQKEVRKLYNLLQEKIRVNSLSGICLIGPAPAYLQRIKNKFRWQIIVRGNDLSGFLSDVTMSPSWIIDIDPVSLL